MTSGGALGRRLAPLRRSPGYTRFWCAATLARVANEMAAVGVVLYVLDRTGSAAWAGATLAAITLPSIVTGPILGAWLDRGGRRLEAIRLDQAVSAGSLALVAVLAGEAPDALLPLVALPAGVTFPLSTGGFSSLIPSYVDASLRVQANALEASSYNTAIVAGPALAGALATAIDPLAAVLVQIGLKLCALVLTLMLRPRGRLPSRPDISVRRIALEGFRLLAASRPLLRGDRGRVGVARRAGPARARVPVLRRRGARRAAGLRRLAVGGVRRRVAPRRRRPARDPGAPPPARDRRMGGRARPGS